MKRQLPKNVRQIGNVSDSSKIYIEDYVDTFFNQLCEKADQNPVGAFLIGEIVQEEEEDYIYVYGAIRMKEILQKGRDVFINDGTWKNACETCKQYFGDAEILGWFLTSAGQALEVNHNITKVHQKFFSREKSIFVVKEAREKEEKYFIHKFRDLMECGGHYIYYEKNVEMQDYMIATRKKTGMTPSEVIEDTVTKNFRSVIRDKMDKSEQKSHSRFVYGLSTFLVLVVLVIGITMINNYDKMKGVQNSLEQLNESVSKQENEKVVETIGTIVSAEGEDKDKEQEMQGDTTEGTTGTTQGETTQGETTQGEDTQGETTQSETTQGETTQGETTTPEGQGGEKVEASGVEEGDIYTVQKGDTLATISKKIYGDISHVEAICKMNGLEDGNLIFIGQKLLLP
ncbi:MAG: LysM peptidoglycan-binding domain-containing protein [Tyzzerella sp.]|nr:LysM peptidoglycan-binding domain-containing protein [Tyzzerella sp.]